MKNKMNYIEILKDLHYADWKIKQSNSGNICLHKSKTIILIDYNNRAMFLHEVAHIKYRGHDSLWADYYTKLVNKYLSTCYIINKTIMSTTKMDDYCNNKSSFPFGESCNKVFNKFIKTVEPNLNIEKNQIQKLYEIIEVRLLDLRDMESLQQKNLKKGIQINIKNIL